MSDSPRHELTSVDRCCVALIESDGVGAGRYLDSLGPHQTLVVVAGRDHQVIGSRGNTVEGRVAIGFGANSRYKVGFDCVHYLLAVGSAASAGQSYCFVWRCS